MRALDLMGPVPTAAPSDFTVPTPDGASLTLAGYRGRVVLLNFWATWCVPVPGGDAGDGAALPALPQTGGSWSWRSPSTRRTPRSSPSSPSSASRIRSASIPRWRSPSSTACAGFPATFLLHADRHLVGRALGPAGVGLERGPWRHREAARARTRMTRRCRPGPADGPNGGTHEAADLWLTAVALLAATASTAGPEPWSRSRQAIGATPLYVTVDRAVNDTVRVFYVCARVRAAGEAGRAAVPAAPSSSWRSTGEARRGGKPVEGRRRSLRQGELVAIQVMEKRAGWGATTLTTSGTASGTTPSSTRMAHRTSRPMPHRVSAAIGRWPARTSSSRAPSSPGPK